MAEFRTHGLDDLMLDLEAIAEIPDDEYYPFEDVYVLGETYRLIYRSSLLHMMKFR